MNFLYFKINIILYIYGNYFQNKETLKLENILSQINLEEDHSNLVTV